MGALAGISSKVDAPDLARLALRPCPEASLGVFRHQRIQLRLRSLMFGCGVTGTPVDLGQGRPSTRRTHVDDPDTRQASFGRLDPEQPGLAR
jgi:hypothetical protein